MIIDANPLEAISFTDGTTPNLPADKRRPVAIEATVNRELPLDWYYTILQRYTHVSGELKSEIIIKDFHTQPNYIQNKVWDGLKQVMIHITDVMPYQLTIKDIFKQSIKKKGYYDKLKEGATKGDVHSREILRFFEEHSNKYITKMLELDSSVNRLSDYMEILESPFKLSYNLGMNNGMRRNPRRINFSEAVNQKKPSRTISNIAKWSARADAIFVVAQQKAEQYINAPFLAKEMVFRSIRESRAFDEGDQPAISWMNKAREHNVDAIFPFQEYRKMFMHRLHEVDSKQSFYMQTSDIAVGFAKQIYERWGIIEVTKKFDFVSFNGKRITVNVAQEEVNKWKRLGYL